MHEANCVLFIAAVLAERDWIMVFERSSSACLWRKNISFKESGALGGGREREGSLCLWRSDPRGLQTWVLTLNSSLFRVYSACSNFQTTCRVLGILLYIALFPTVSHYSMKLQSVCTRSPGLPLPTRAGSSFMVQRTKPLIGDMLQKTARERRTTFITFPSHTYCNTIHSRLDLRPYWLWIMQQTI